jgi:hypothetical protein
MFNNSYFDNYFELLQLGKNRSFLVHKVDQSFNQTKSGHLFSSIKATFDFIRSNLI